ncbi:MAG: TonB-dependent receptor [Opitutaceae bacterium]|nr:TonB-dependent receptor [Opitutaceae bacterium]
MKVTPVPRKKHPSRHVQVGLALSALALPTTAAAQTATQPATESNEEVIQLPTFEVQSSNDFGYRAGNAVSATRINTPIKELPFTISAFTEDFITDIGALDLQDILRYAPGVTSGDKSFVAGNNRFSIRGFDGDVPPQRNGFAGNRNVDSANVTRVEVVKGPASLLYGQIIPGGTVNYITKRPTDKRFVSIKQSVGNESDFRTVLDVNQPVNKRIGLRFVASYDQAPKWAETGSTHSYLFAPSASIKLLENVTLVVDYERLKRFEEPSVGMMPNVQIAGFSGAPSSSVFVNKAARSYQQGLFDAGSINLGFLGAIPIDDRFNYQGNNDYKRSDYENANVELTAKLGGHWVARANYSWNARDTRYKLTGLAQWDVTPTAAYRTADKSYLDYLNEYLADPVGVLNDKAKTTSVLLNRRKRIQTSGDSFNTYQMDLSGAYEVKGIKLNPLFGIYRQHSRTGGGFTLSSSSSYGNYSDSDGALPFAPWNYFDSSTWLRDKNYDEYSLPVSSSGGVTRGLEDAYYGVLTAKLFRDRVVLVGGARYDRYRSGGASGFTFEAKKTTPQYGIGVNVHKDVLLFANYSKSFLVDGTTLTVENPNYDPAKPFNQTTNNQFIRTPASPTTGLGYEAGIKTDFNGGRISSTLTVFHLERADRIVTVRQPVAGLNANGVPSITEVTFSKQGTVDESEGVEFEMTYTPLENWQIYATYTNMKIRTTKLTTPTPRTSSDPRANADYEAYLRGFNDAVAMLLGATPEGSSERLASLWTRYTFNAGKLKGFWVAGGGTYTSEKAQRTANPRLFLDAYTLLDAAMGYDWKMGNQKWNASLNFKNITDETYYPANQSRGRPRQVVLNVGVKF